MREATFIEAVHRKLDLAIHRQSMTGASTNMNGTPDRYYDCGTGARDLWVEYKYWPRIPKLQPRLVGEKSGQVTALQCNWLQRRWRCGQNAYVIVGTKIEGRAFGAIVRASDLLLDRQLRFVPIAEVATWINRFVLQGET